MKRIALASLLVTGLLACRADQLLPPPPSGLIRDAGHNGGNFFFAFLQPLVMRPTLNGVFDPTQSPIVKVELLSGNAPCVDPNLTYTMSTGPGSETIRVSPTDRHYIVNLHTDQVPVISGCTYRIRVLIGLTELGFADIALFLNQMEAKNLTNNETVDLVDGRTLPVKFWIAEGVLRDFGQGTASPNEETIIVTQNRQAGVLIPAGAVLVPTTITIESVDDRPCFPGLLGRTLQGSAGATENSCYRFTTDPPLPDGKFETNVIVGICVDLSLVTEAEEDKLQILQFDDGDTPRIQALANASAPFLPCDPSFPTPIGLEAPNLLTRAARWLASVITPRPLFARANNMVFDLGAGGSAEGFSLFTWGFVTNMEINDGDEQSALPGTEVETPPSVIFSDSTGAPVDSVPVTFSVGLGGGSITSAVTKSGRGGIPGVAQVGSWTLGSAGTNTLTASAPEFSGVTPTSVTFTATGITSTLTGYEVVTSGAIPLAASEGFARGVAQCPAGKVVLGGGTQVVGEGTADFNTRLQESAPGIVGTSTNVWLVSIDNEDARPHTVDFYAVCASAPPGYQVVTTDVVIPAGSFAVTLANCPAGKVVLSGGAQVAGELDRDFDTRLQESGPVTMGPGTPTSIWRATVRNQDEVQHTVRVFAVCALPPSGYQVVSGAVTALTGFDRDAVPCPAGKVVVGGGGQAVGAGLVGVTRLQESAPGTTGLNNETSVWLVSMKNLDAAARDVQFFAVCANAT